MLPRSIPFGLRLTVPVALVGALGCGAARLDGEGVFALRCSDPDRAYLRYRDGQVSLNDACMIKLENGLSPKIPPCYVNGQPVGFC